MHVWHASKADVTLFPPLEASVCVYNDHLQHTPLTATIIAIGSATALRTYAATCPLLWTVHTIVQNAADSRS